MDEIVRQALAKWPNVPHCYGWLALDARGNWRMRDERAQRLGLVGDRIAHPALLGFINRNYGADARGCWHFQNGPQRVYVDLEAAPHIVRTDPEQGLLLHTGRPFGLPEAVFMTASGRILLQSGALVALLDDRDAGEFLPRLEVGGLPADDEALLAWLKRRAGDGCLALRQGGQALPVRRLEDAGVADHFGFVQNPQPDVAPTGAA